MTILFYAAWCGFSSHLMPSFREKADELPGTVVAVDISSTRDPLWDRFEIDTVPTVVVVEGSTTVARADGIPGRGLGPEDLDRLPGQVP